MTRQIPIVPAAGVDLDRYLAHHVDCPARWRAEDGPCLCGGLVELEEARWQKAKELNDRPDACWANIVSWVLLNGDADAIFDQRICMNGMGAGPGTCYCGKITAPGVLAK